MLKWNSRHQLLRSDFFHKLSLHLTRVQSPTRWTIALFPAHTHRSMIRYLWRSYKCVLKHRHCILPTFLCINRPEPLFERLLSCAESNENKYFLRPEMLMQYWMYAGGRNAQECLYLTVCHMTMFYDTTAVFEPSRSSSLSELRPRLNSFHGTRGWCFIAKQKCMLNALLSW